MSKAGRKILITLICVYAFSFLVLLGWSFFMSPPVRTGSLKTNWIIGNTLALFTRSFVPVHLSALLFSFSLFFPFKSTGEGKKVFFARLRFMGVTFLILLLLYTVLLEAGLPTGLRIREEAVSKVRQADDLRLKAKDAVSRGQFREAQRYFQYALTLFPEDEELRHETDAAGRAAKTAGQISRNQPPAAESSILLNMSFEDFLMKARNAFEREDYISAEYYASFALRMNLDHPAPKRIIAEARQKITESLPSREFRETMDFFRRKQAGADLLTDGDVIEAYRYLQTLHEERPDDPDVRHYLRVAYAELQKEAFLLSEIPLTAMSESPSGDGVMFLNKSGGDGTDKEFLYIRRLIKTDTAYYALDIEGLGIGPDGTILYQFGALYGKFTNEALLTRCIDDEAGRDYRPEYYKGESPDSIPFQIPVMAGPEELLRISTGDAGYNGVALWSLVQTAGAAAILGVSPYPLYMAFFSRIFLPFSFFVLSFLAAAFGLRYRSRYAAFPPLPYFLFLPFLPFIMIPVFHVYEYSLFTLQGFLLSFFGFTVSAIAFCAVQGLLLFFAVLVFARQFRP